MLWKGKFIIIFHCFLYEIHQNLNHISSDNSWSISESTQSADDTCSFLSPLPHPVLQNFPSLWLEKINLKLPPQPNKQRLPSLRNLVTASMGNEHFNSSVTRKSKVPPCCCILLGMTGLHLFSRPRGRSLAQKPRQHAIFKYVMHLGPISSFSISLSLLFPLLVHAEEAPDQESHGLHSASFSDAAKLNIAVLNWFMVLAVKPYVTSSESSWLKPLSWPRQ